MCVFFFLLGFSPPISHSQTMTFPYAHTRTLVMRCGGLVLFFFFFFFLPSLFCLTGVGCGGAICRPVIANEGADRFYDRFSHSFQALKSEVEDYMDLLRVLSTQLQYVPPEQETFHLSINGRPIGLALLAIANALNGDEHVTQLSLETTGIDKESIGILASVLTVNHTVKELYLTGNNLGPEGVRVLVKALASNSTLVTLHLGSTACGDEGSGAIVSLLGGGKTGLRRLNLSRCGITEAGFALLEECVRQNEQIVELDLRDNVIPKEMTESLNELLKLRFKPYMAELKRQEGILELQRKSAKDMAAVSKGGKGRQSPKGFSSLKLKLKKKRPSGRIVTSTDEESSSPPESLSPTSEVDLVDFLRTQPPPRNTTTTATVKVPGHEVGGGVASTAADALKLSGDVQAPAPRPARDPSKITAEEAGKVRPRQGSNSAPSSPRGEEESTPDNPRVKAAQNKHRSGSLSTVKSGAGAAAPVVKPSLRLHIIEAARLKPVQKNGASDPYCHAGHIMDVRGKKITTAVQRRTLSPHWDQWFEVALDDLSDWMFQLHLQDAKLSGAKGALGHVVVSCKDWDLSDEVGQEQWIDVVDGLGSVKIGMQAQGANLLICKTLALKRKEAEKKEREAQAAAIEARSGRPRGRTMLAAPPKVMLPAVPKIPHTKSSSCTVGTAETIGRRPTMEDAILVQGDLGGDPRRDLFAVFDGHGSQKVAVYCAEKFGEVVLRHLKAGDEPLVALRSSFLDLSAEVAPWAINMGCTAVAALVMGRTVHVANCGDTRAVLCSSVGIAERLTLDHKPSLPEEVARIEALGGVVRNGRVQGQLAVSRALGDANFAPFISPEPYLRSVTCTEDNTHLILACDGLWDVFPDSLAGQIVANQPEPSDAAAMLRDRAFASGSTDNISVIVVRFDGEKQDSAAPPPDEDSSTSEASHFDTDDEAAGKGKEGGVACAAGGDARLSGSDGKISVMDRKIASE